MVVRFRHVYRRFFDIKWQIWYFQGVTGGVPVDSLNYSTFSPICQQLFAIKIIFIFSNFWKLFSYHQTAQVYDTAQHTQNKCLPLQARIGRYWYMLTMCKTFSCCHPTKIGGVFTFSTRFTTSPPRCYHQFHSSFPVSDSTTIPSSSLLILFVNFFVKTPYYPSISTS